MATRSYKKALTTLTKAQVSDLESIIEKRELRPVIVNPSSKFVVITYWWGRNNKNKNTQYPCPEDVVDGVVERPPINFEHMIEKWVQSCVGARCNYLVQEYPEFVGPGKYQMAINAKPYFIKNALKACGDRAVVYIDGDMFVRRYPAIFDMSNVDFMARGWNIDPRASVKYARSHICFDPYNFETSGGTMYFGNSPKAYKLLDLWASASSKKMFEGKADDRILSMIFTMYNMVLPLNIIQLPIEYLWLTGAYTPEGKPTYLNKGDWRAKSIYLEHPACLTSEERAREQGAANNRNPRFYDRLVENQIDCENHGGLFLEYVFFPKESMVSAFQPYLSYLSRAVLFKEDGEDVPPMHIVKYADRYGKYNAIADANWMEAENWTVQTRVPMVTITESMGGGRKKKGGDTESVSHKTIQDVNRVARSELIGAIIATLKSGKDVLYIPWKKDVGSIQPVIQAALDPTVEFVAVNQSDVQVFPTFYKNGAMYLSHKSDILPHALCICSTMSDLSNIMRSSYMFKSRIRCAWVDIDDIGNEEVSEQIFEKSQTDARTKMLHSIFWKWNPRK